MSDLVNLPPDSTSVDADDLAAAILDGAAIDWHAIPSRLGEGLIDEFRVLEALAAVHRPSAASDDTSLESERANIGTWGRLTLIECVGEGSFGKVYRAWDPSLHRQVALKLLSETTSPAASLASALNEARLLARVEHPHVLTVHGAERADGQAGIWTAFIEGRTLDALVRTDGPMAPEVVAAIGADLCDAVSAVHAAHLLHRDIKAQNVMRERGGRIVLMDFGAGFDLSQTTRPGDVTGTPLYLAPEILTGSRASRASDVYALAVLLFYLLTRSHPVQGRTLVEIREAHRLGRVRRLKDVRPDVPSDLARVIERGLARDPAERYQSAEEFGRELRAIQPTAGRLWWSRLPSLRSTLAAACAAILTVAAVWLVRSPNDSRHTLDRTDFPRSDSNLVGRVSADGRFVPYVDVDGNLAVFEVATGAARRVVSKVGPDEGPGRAAMSPNGDRVVYPWKMANGFYELRMAYSDGTWSRALISKESAFEPLPQDWSRDGRWITCWFKEHAGPFDLALIPVDGGAPRVLATVRGSNPARAPISPDGRFVVYPSKNGCNPGDAGGTVFCVVGTDGSAARILAPRASNDGAPSWTPDSEGLLYIRIIADENRQEAWALPVSNGRAIGRPHLIARDLGGVANNPHLTDSGALTFGRYTTEGQLYTSAIDLERRTLGPPVRVSNAPRGHAAGVWSADGRMLAYVTQQGEPNGYRRPVTLTVQDISSAVERTLPVDVPFLSSYAPAFIGKDALVVWGGDPDHPERFGFYRVDLATGRTTVVALRPEIRDDPITFAITPDGRTLLYGDYARGLVAYDLATGTENVLLAMRQGEAPLSVCASARGGEIAIATALADSSREVSVLANGTRRIVLHTKVDDIGTVGFSPDGHAVVVSRFPLTGVNGDTPSRLSWVPAAGGVPIDLLSSVLTIRSSRISISPDGHRLLYAELTSLNQLFMQHNFLTGLRDILKHPEK